MSPSLFLATRLKLTLQYTLIMVAISALISSIFFFRTNQVLRLEFDRINHRFLMEEQGMMPRLGPNTLRRRINPDDLVSAREHLLRQLVFINLIVLAGTFGLGYLLSGFTLRPIGAAMEEQNRFISDASHELKTPLTALKASLEINLMDKKNSSRTKQILKANLKDVQSLESLTESLLKLSTTPTSDSHGKPTSLKPVLKVAIEQLTPLAHKKHIKLTLKPIEGQLKVAGDQLQLQELFQIFIDNAIKYSPPHTPITISVTSNTKHAHISIADQGIGIAQEHQAHIFDRFYQVDPSRSKSNSNGFGLGLALAKKIVDQHHGHIKLESTPQKGSTFTISLPLA